MVVCHGLGLGLVPRTVAMGGGAVPKDKASVPWRTLPHLFRNIY